MENGQKKVSTLVLPPTVKKDPALTCHRFFAPVVIPEQSPINPAQMNITPRLGNFDCIKARCMLWNEEKSECYDVSNAKAQITLAQYAYNKMNDASVEGGGM